VLQVQPELLERQRQPVWCQPQGQLEQRQVRQQPEQRQEPGQSREPERWGRRQPVPG